MCVCVCVCDRIQCMVEFPVVTLVVKKNKYLFVKNFINQLTSTPDTKSDFRISNREHGYNLFRAVTVSRFLVFKEKAF